MTRSRPEPIVTGQGGVKLLIIHGWYSDHSLFNALVAALGPARFTIARFDIRGYGSSRGIAGRFDLREIAEDALAVADGLGWRHFSVLGHSMGGKVAQKIAIDHPDRVRSVIALTPVPAKPLGFDADTQAFFAKATEDDEVAAAIVGQSAGPSRDADWVRLLVAETRRIALPEAFGSYARSFIGDDLSAGAERLAMPILVLFGAEDRGVDPILLEPVYRGLYSHARIERIAGTGHYPMVDDPAGLARCVADFLVREP
jgi:pimeloyl-ACP methyl ester carboxylesterase